MRAWKLAVGLLLAQVAEAACEAPLQVTHVFPAEAATAVPTNARVWVHATHGDDDVLSITLWRGDTQVAGALSTRSGGTLSAGGHNVSVLRPQDPLAANTEYRIEIEGPSLELPEGQSRLVSSFTTGAGPQVEAPTWAGIQAAQHSVVAASSEGCEAGPERWRFDVEGAAPAAGAVAYAVYRLGLPLANGASPSLVYEGFPEPGQTEICLQARAIDIAGNVDDNTAELCVPVDAPDDTDPQETGRETGWEPWPPETGWRDTWRWDSGWRDTGWRRNGDCGVLTVRICATSPAAGGALVVPLALLLLLRRRR